MLTVNSNALAMKSKTVEITLSSKHKSLVVVKPQGADHYRNILSVDKPQTVEGTLSLDNNFICYSAREILLGYNRFFVIDRVWW